MTYPVFWSFRRCPYAMRARLALRRANVTVELREIALRDKPDAFLQASKSGTVPVLVTKDSIIDESLDIMLWACNVSGDRDGWYHDYYHSDRIRGLINTLDTEFKTNLDRYKYATRYHQDKAAATELAIASRQKGADFIWQLNDMLGQNDWLAGNRAGLIDMASLPFIRQFRIADQNWFDAQQWSEVSRWLSHFLDSDLFASVMKKYPLWKEENSKETL